MFGEIDDLIRDNHEQEGCEHQLPPVPNNTVLWTGRILSAQTLSMRILSLADRKSEQMGRHSSTSIALPMWSIRDRVSANFEQAARDELTVALGRANQVSHDNFKTRIRTLEIMLMRGCLLEFLKMQLNHWKNNGMLGEPGHQRDHEARRRISSKIKDNVIKYRFEKNITLLNIVFCSAKMEESFQQLRRENELHQELKRGVSEHSVTIPFLEHQRLIS